MPNVRLNTDARTHWPSRNIARTAAFLLAGLVCVRPSGAQGVPADSLAARLQRAEAAIATLQGQIAEQAQSGARTRSGAALEIWGRVMVNGFNNSRRVNNVDNPQFAVPGPVGTFSRGAGMAIRESQLGIVVAVPDVMGGSFIGDLDVDFYGGQMPSSGGRTFPLLRLRTARGVVRWSNSHLLIGQESPLISRLNPMTPVTIGTPLFATAGNLWLWLPQVRGGVETGTTTRVGLQAAVLAPSNGDPAGAFDTDYDAAERTQRPFLQARVHVASGEAPLAREIGCGVHRGWVRPIATRKESKAFACDARLPITELVEVRGEFFTGEALRGLGGGGIGQPFIPDTTRGVRTTGGWGQVNVFPVARLRLGAGCGADHPEAVGLLRRRNDSCAAYAVRSVGPLFFAGEVRRLRTEYVAGRITADHVTFATGFEF